MLWELWETLRRFPRFPHLSVTHHCNTYTCDADQKYHALTELKSGWHTYIKTDVPEEGHWEQIWVEDP